MSWPAFLWTDRVQSSRGFGVGLELAQPSCMSQRAPLSSFNLALLALAATIVVGAAGCYLGCGVSPVPTHAPDGGTVTGAVDENGVVTFTAIPVGSSEAFSIPVKDTADTDETIMSAGLSGTGRANFVVLTTFPLFLPAGQTVMVEVQFTPDTPTVSEAELVLQTEKMGPSPMHLTGTGLAD